MTDSDLQVGGNAARAVAGEERRRGARAVFHRQGVEHTTLADVATAAEVPLGNIYYYFRTKDELVEAVIAAHAQDIAEQLGMLERHHRTPKTRLKALVRMLTDQRDLITLDLFPHSGASALS